MSLQGLQLLTAFSIGFWARHAKHRLVWHAPAVPASDLTNLFQLHTRAPLLWATQHSASLNRPSMCLLSHCHTPLLHLAKSYLLWRLHSEKSSSRKDSVFRASPLQVWVRSALFAPGVCAHRCGGTVPPVVWFSGSGQKTNTSCLSL